MTIRLRYLTGLLLTCTALTPALAQQRQAGPAAGAPNVAELQQRVAFLEQELSDLKAKVQEMEQRLAATAPEQPVNKEQVERQKQLAHQRMVQDAKRYTREQLTEVENLYQAANKDLSSPAARAALEKLITQYPQTNRTGCAVLYLGQMSKDADREKYLRQAIERHSDCFYGNGVQVGAFGRYLLMQHYQEAGQADQAKQIADDLRTRFPDAIDHRGQSLVGRLPKE